MDNSAKQKALNQALAQIEKQYGKGTVMRLGENSVMNTEVIPTGILSVDIASGIGGLPRGRIIELFGPEASGKTTVALHAVAEAQKMGGEAAFIDAEHALDPYYAQKLGVDIDSLLVSQPDNGEQALEIAEALIRSNAIDIIVIDSVAALVPKDEIEGVMTDVNMGLHARLMSKAMRKLTSVISKSKTIAIFINQLREKMSTGFSYGPSEVTTGGKALKFYSSMRIDVRRMEAIKEGTEIKGNRVKIKFVKNKVAPPFKQGDFDIMFGEGASKTGCLVDLGVEAGYIAKSGAWFSYGDIRLGQGRENTKRFLEENKDIYDELDKKIRDKYMNIPGEENTSPAEEEEADDGGVEM